MAFSLAQKKEIFTALCSVGVEEIELGIATGFDADLPQLITFCRSAASGSRLALWSRCRLEDITLAHSLQPDVLSLSIPVSDIHIKKKLGCTRAWVLETAGKSIAKARQLGFKVVSLGLEDATRAEQEFLNKIIAAAIKAGADRIRLADTVGVANPGKIAELVKCVKNIGPVEVGVHAHNDFGMATANSLAALDAGADWADVTILGLGERAGNARHEELAGYLALQGRRDVELRMLADLARKVAAMSGRIIEPHKPIVGENIFCCESGLHLQGLRQDTSTYEPFAPDAVGARRKLRFGGKIGRKDIKNCFAEIKKQAANIDIDDIVLRVRNKAAAKGRPLKRRELLTLVSSAFEG